MREPSTLKRVLLVAGITLREALRRRIVVVAVLMSVAFLALYGEALHLAAGSVPRLSTPGGLSELGSKVMGAQLLWMGLFPASFLIALTAVFISVGTISNELETNVAYSLVSLPIRRAEIIAGKFLGLAAMLYAYALVFDGGVIALARWQLHAPLVRAWPLGLALVAAESLPLLALAVLGSTRLPTLANGVMCVAAYGLAFIGGLIESIGSLLSNDSLINTGIVSSLIMPLDALHRLALVLVMPSGLLLQDGLPGIGKASNIPSVWMLVYALGHVVVLIALAARSFGRRDL